MSRNVTQKFDGVERMTLLLTADCKVSVRWIDYVQTMTILIFEHWSQDTITAVPCSIYHKSDIRLFCFNVKPSRRRTRNN